MWAMQAANPPDLTAVRALLDQPLDFDPRMEPNKVAERLAQLRQAVENLDTAHAGNIDRQEAAELVQRMTGQIKTLMQGQSLPNLAHIGHELVAEVAARIGQRWRAAGYPGPRTGGRAA